MIQKGIPQIILATDQENKGTFCSIQLNHERSNNLKSEHYSKYLNDKKDVFGASYNTFYN